MYVIKKKVIHLNYLSEDEKKMDWPESSLMRKTK